MTQESAHHSTRSTEPSQVLGPLPTTAFSLKPLLAANMACTMAMMIDDKLAVNARRRRTPLY